MCFGERVTAAEPIAQLTEHLIRPVMEPFRANHSACGNVPVPVQGLSPFNDQFWVFSEVNNAQTNEIMMKPLARWNNAVTTMCQAIAISAIDCNQ